MASYRLAIAPRGQAEAKALSYQYPTLYYVRVTFAHRSTSPDERGTAGGRAVENALFVLWSLERLCELDTRTLVRSSRRNDGGMYGLQISN